MDPIYHFAPNPFPAYLREDLPYPTAPWLVSQELFKRLAAAPEIPNELLKQLKPNGLIVIPLGGGETQQMIRIKRLENNIFEKETFSNFTFVPMLKGMVD